MSPKYHHYFHILLDFTEFKVGFFGTIVNPWLVLTHWERLITLSHTLEFSLSSLVLISRFVYWKSEGLDICDLTKLHLANSF